MIASLYGKLAALERILQVSPSGIRWLAQETLASAWSLTGWQALQIDAASLGSRRDVLKAFPAAREVDVPVRPP